MLDALALGQATTSSWSSGLAAAYGNAGSDDRWVFVSPPVDGWILAVSSRWPYPAGETHPDIAAGFDLLFSRLMRRFDDVQFFGSHRVSDFAAWARALNGAPTRIFAYGDGEVAMNFGDQTPEETKLGLTDLTGLSPSDAGEEIFRVVDVQDEEEESLIASGLSPAEALAAVRQKGRRLFPEEDSVIDLAALWSLDPTRLADQDHPPGLGWTVRLPDDLR